MTNELRSIPLSNIPLIKSGDELSSIIMKALNDKNIEIETSDVLVIAQKIVSKAEDSIVELNTINPSKEAEELAIKTGRDPKLCQVYLNESNRILEVKGPTIVTEHKLGFICTSAGVDRSNIGPTNQNKVSLLPKDPDKSARTIRDSINKSTSKKIAVIITDSFGKPDREGCYGIAIGIAGIAPLEVRQSKDLFGNNASSKIALIDELAASASILMGQTDEKIPVVLIKGAKYTVDEQADIKKILIKG